MKIYPTNLTDNQYATILRIIGDNRKRQSCLHDVLDAIFYLLKTGCQWRMLPSDFQKWQCVYYYFQKWSRDGTIEEIYEVLKKCSLLLHYMGFGEILRKRIGTNSVTRQPTAIQLA